MTMNQSDSRCYIINAYKTHRWAFASTDSMTTAYTITATTQYL